MPENLDIIYWIKWVGYFGVLIIVFIECGVFVGFFLPGDSLLFSAGLLASHGVFNIVFLIPGMIIMAFLGYLFGYWFGEKMGDWLVKRPDSIWFKKAYIRQAKKFYRKHGRKAVMFGRLVPFIRTFVPIVAGMVRMSYGPYVIFNAIGAIIWAGGATLMGYYLGDLIPNMDKYIAPMIIVVILGSIGIGLLLRKYHP
jgi:membrane-associated protein